MQPILNNKELEERIEYLENKTKRQKEQLKELLQESYESIKPQNLLKNAFADAVAEPQVRTNMLNTSVGLLTGLLTNKLVIGSSAGIIKRLAGTALQIGITKLIANKFPEIKEKAQQLLHKKPAGKKIAAER